MRIVRKNVELFTLNLIDWRESSRTIKILLGKGDGLTLEFFFSGFGCVSLGTVIHEMLHASGFWHEQSRPDRDQHVRILWSNIYPGREDNFARYTRAEVSTLSLPYDTSSVMHYSSRAFSRNGQMTISPIK